MYKLSDRALHVLKTYNDWTEYRNIDIEHYRKHFEETGQPTSDVIFDFLRSFGGLEIGVPTAVKIDPMEVTGDNLSNFDSDSLEEYTRNWIRKPVAYIGHDYSGEYFLMAITGEIYSAFDSWVVKVGNSVEEAIENIIAFKSLERITKR